MVQTAATSSSGTDTPQSTSCYLKPTTTWSTACSRTLTTPVSPADVPPEPGRCFLTCWCCSHFLLCFSSGFFRDRLWYQDLVATGRIAEFQQSPRWGGRVNPQKRKQKNQTHRKTFLLLLFPSRSSLGMSWCWRKRETLSQSQPLSCYECWPPSITSDQVHKHACSTLFLLDQSQPLFNICLFLFADRVEGDRSEGSGQENEDEQ